MYALAAVAGDYVLYRPDIFKCLVLMIVPFGGASTHPFNIAENTAKKVKLNVTIQQGLGIN